MNWGRTLLSLGESLWQGGRLQGQAIQPHQAPQALAQPGLPACKEAGPWPAGPAVCFRERTAILEGPSGPP